MAEPDPAENPVATSTLVGPETVNSIVFAEGDTVSRKIMGKTIFFSTKRRQNVRGTKAFWCIVPSRPASRRPSVPSRTVPPSFHFCCPVPSRGGTGRDGTVLVPHPAELWDLVTAIAVLVISFFFDICSLRDP